MKRPSPQLLSRGHQTLGSTSNAPEAQELVLSTLNRDGSRRWIRPKTSRGKHYRRRFITAWALMATFTLIPIIKLGGKPLMLFDIPKA